MHIMQGWRCKIGLLVPIDNLVIEPEFVETAPDGVTTHSTRLRTMKLPDMPTDAEPEAENLGVMGADVIAYACNASSFVDGPGGDERIANRLGELAGVPATTASTAMVRALHAVDAESAAVISPYADEEQRRLREFIEGNGVDVTTLTGMDLAADEPEGLAEMNEETAEDTYRRVRTADTGDADVVFVASTNIESFGRLNELEVDLGKPVMSTNQALLWHALQLANVTTDSINVGSLFAERATE